MTSRGTDAIGRRIEIFWQGTEHGDVWYAGTITKFEGGRHHVLYDDGDEDWYVLDEITYRFEALGGEGFESTHFVDVTAMQEEDERIAGAADDDSSGDERDAAADAPRSLPRESLSSGGERNAVAAAAAAELEDDMAPLEVTLGSDDAVAARAEARPQGGASAASGAAQPPARAVTPSTGPPVPSPAPPRGPRPATSFEARSLDRHVSHGVITRPAGSPLGGGGDSAALQRTYTAAPGSWGSRPRPHTGEARVESSDAARSSPLRSPVPPRGAPPPGHPSFRAGSGGAPAGDGDDPARGRGSERRVDGGAGAGAGGASESPPRDAARSPDGIDASGSRPGSGRPTGGPSGSGGGGAEEGVDGALAVTPSPRGSPSPAPGALGRAGSSSRLLEQRRHASHTPSPLRRGQTAYLARGGAGGSAGPDWRGRQARRSLGTPAGGAEDDGLDFEARVARDKAMLTAGIPLLNPDARANGGARRGSASSGDEVDAKEYDGADLDADADADAGGDDKATALPVDATREAAFATARGLGGRRTSFLEGDESHFQPGAVVPAPPTPAERALIESLQRDVETERIPDYAAAFHDAAREDEVVVAQLSKEEALRREAELEAARIAAAQDETARYHARELSLATRERQARSRVKEQEETAAQRLRRRERQTAERVAAREAGLHRVFRRAEAHLKDALAAQQGLVRERYGELEPGRAGARKLRVEWERMPQPLEIRVSTVRALKDKVPKGRYVVLLTLYDRLGGEPLRWQRLGLAGGAGRMRPGCTHPAYHYGRFYDTDLNFDESVFTVCPAPADTHPSNVFVIELFLLGTSRNPVDRVVGWGALPMSDADFQAVSGRFKLPLLAGEVDLHLDKYEKVENAIATDLGKWLANLYLEVRHLPRTVVDAEGVERREFDVELSYTSEMLRLPGDARARQWDAAEDEEDDAESSEWESGGESDGEGAAGGELVESVSRGAAGMGRASIASGTMRGGAHGYGVATDDERRPGGAGGAGGGVRRRRKRSTTGGKHGAFLDGAMPSSPAPPKSAQAAVATRPRMWFGGRAGAGGKGKGNGTGEAGGAGEEEQRSLLRPSSDLAQRAAGGAGLTKVGSFKRGSSLGRGSSLLGGGGGGGGGGGADAPSVPSLKLPAAGSAGMPGSARSRAISTARGGGAAVRAGGLVAAVEGAAGAATDARGKNASIAFGGADDEGAAQHLASYQFSVSRIENKALRRSRLAESARKVRYLQHELKGSLRPSQLTSTEFGVQLMTLVAAWWLRVYIHYLGQWLFLRSTRVPVYDFRPQVYTMTLKYVSKALPTEHEIGVVIMGQLSVITFMVAMVGVAWLCQRVLGHFPEVSSRFVAFFGVGAVLDSLFVFVVDLVSRNFDCASVPECAADVASAACTCTEGDAFKLYFRFEREEGNGFVGAFLTLFLFAALVMLAAFVLYVFLLHVHLDGRMLDVYRRLNGTEGAFFVPHDFEVSPAELQWIMARAARWHHPKGIHKRAAVCEYELTDPLDPAFKEVTTHLIIYKAAATGGNRELHRHFLRLPDGSVLEMFGSLEKHIGSQFDALEALLLKHGKEERGEVEKFFAGLEPGRLR